MMADGDVTRFESHWSPKEARCSMNKCTTRRSLPRVRARSRFKTPSITSGTGKARKDVRVHVPRIHIIH